MKPSYIPAVFDDISLDEVLDSTPWIQVTDARLECFMSTTTATYTYGEGRGARTYVPVPYTEVATRVQEVLNVQVSLVLDEHPRRSGRFNVCFLNRYDNAAMQLGWHSDDSPGMDHYHPIGVVSFGQAREIWWREKGQTGIIPADQRQLLKHGSLFVMPAGMQRTHQHRIPKGDKPMATRVSLTYRHYAPVLTFEDYEAGIKKVTNGLSQDEVERRYKDMVMNDEANDLW